MAITNFIPTVWSEHLLCALDKQYIGVANCNRDWEGDIQGKGSSVKICGIRPITIGEYTKNTDMSNPQELDEVTYDLVIDQAKYFNFQIDDIDKVQSSPKLMDLAMRSAAEAIANDADRYIYQMYKANSFPSDAINDLHGEELFKRILFAREYIMQNGVINPSDIVFEVSPYVATELLRAKMDTAPSTETYETGCIGSIAGMKVFVSNNVDFRNEGSQCISSCYMRSKRAIAFAEQFSQIEAYRPEKRFAEAVKGLHLYGAKLVYPNEILNFCICYDIANDRV